MEHFASYGPVKRAILSSSTSGNNTVVAAVAGKKIRVLGYSCSSSGTVTVLLQDGAGGATLLSSAHVAGSTAVFPISMVGWGDTTAATLLNANLSGNVATLITVIYQEV